MKPRTDFWQRLLLLLSMMVLALATAAKPDWADSLKGYAYYEELADLEVSISPVSFVAGESRSVQVQVENLGPDRFPGGPMTFIAEGARTIQAETGCLAFDGLVCQLGAIEAHETREIEFDVHYASHYFNANPSVGTTVFVSASVISNEGGPDRTNNQADLHTRLDRVHVIETSAVAIPSVVGPGQRVAYLVSIASHGPSDVVNMLIDQIGSNTEHDAVVHRWECLYQDLANCSFQNGWGSPVMWIYLYQSPFTQPRVDLLSHSVVPDLEDGEQVCFRMVVSSSPSQLPMACAEVRDRMFSDSMESQ